MEGTARRPHISVAMATFNGEAFVSEQLESLRQQWRQPDELIVVDDASTDNTVAVVREFAKTAPFPVLVVDRSEHLGTNATFGHALSLTSGDIVVTCDQDDRWYPDKISILTGALKAQPDAFVAFSDARLIDGEGREIGRSRWAVAGFSQAEQAAMSRDPLGQMLARRIMSGCTTAIRRELLDAVLPMPAGLTSDAEPIMYDRWLSLVGAAAGPVVLVPRQLVDYRIHPRQQIGIPGLSFRRYAPRLTLLVAQFRASRDEVNRRMEFESVHVEEIRSRLIAADLSSPATERILQMAQRHLNCRLELDQARYRRVPYVVAELRHKDGYRRFAFGAATALADIAR